MRASLAHSIRAHTCHVLEHNNALSRARVTYVSYVLTQQCSCARITLHCARVPLNVIRGSLTNALMPQSISRRAYACARGAVEQYSA